MKDLTKYKNCIVAPLLTEGVKQYNDGGVKDLIYITSEAVDKCAKSFVSVPSDIDHIANDQKGQFNNNRIIGFVVDCFKNLDGFKLGDETYEPDGITYHVISIDDDKIKQYNLDFDDIRRKIFNKDKNIGVSSVFKTPNEKYRTGIEGFAEKVNVVEDENDLIPISATITINSEPRFFGCRHDHIYCNSLDDEDVLTKKGKNVYELKIQNIKVNLDVEDVDKKINEIKDKFDAKDIEDCFNCSGEILSKEPKEVIFGILFSKLTNIEDFYNLLDKLDIYDRIINFRISENHAEEIKNKNSVDIRAYQLTCRADDKLYDYHLLLEYIVDRKITDENIRNQIDKLKVTLGEDNKLKQKIFIAYLAKKQNRPEVLDELNKYGNY